MERGKYHIISSNRRFSRREFLMREIPDGAKTAVVIAVSVGIAGTALYALEKSASYHLNSDQKKAQILIDQAKQDNSLVAVKVKAIDQNPFDELDQRANWRLSPAVLNSNYRGKLDAGKKLEGIIVASQDGYQKSIGDNSNWFAFRVNSQNIGFTNLDNIQKEDGTPLMTAGAKIYDLQSGRVTIIGDAQ